MRRTSCLGALASALCMSAAVSCTPTSDTPSVAFGSSAPVGRWQATHNAGQPDAGRAAASGNLAPSSYVAGRSAPPAADGGSGEPLPASPPHAGITAPATSAGGSAALAAGSGGVGQPAAGSGGVGQPAAGGGGAGAVAAVTSISFEVTTSAVGGRYQPKNIGAIWIEDNTGKLVKTLQVWAGVRRRYLTGYLGVLAGGTIDVTTSATLPRHQTHTVSWDLKDRNGVTVTPGKYRLRMELTDSDQTGRSNTIELDAGQGPVMLTPSDAPSFGAMKLTLQ